MKKTTDLGKDKVPLLVLKLAIPSMIAQFVNVLYSTVDRMFIGNIKGIGDVALAGVGVCGPIVTLLTSFGTLIGLGGSILMAMRMGAGRKKQAENNACKVHGEQSFSENSSDHGITAFPERVLDHFSCNIIT